MLFASYARYQTERVEVRFDNQDILALHTVGELHAYVARRLREQNKTA